MELILINENKLKIMMNVSDMKSFGLNENDFHLSITNTRSILKKILQASPIKTGFEDLLPSDKILLQMYPEIHGGCELFITKVSIDNAPYIKEDPFMPCDEEKYLLPQPHKRITENKKTPLTYSFTEIEHVIRSCKELKKRNFNGESSLYLHNDGKYFLFLIKFCDESAESLSYLSEFGELENTENAIFSVLERGRCIFKQNAAEELSNL